MSEEPIKLEENWRNPDGTLKKGHPDLGAGRPKGPTLKEWVRQKLIGMTPEEREIFLKDVSKETQWKMAEGLPKESVDVQGDLNIYANLTDEQKLQRIRQCLEGIRNNGGETKSDIPVGENTPLPENGADTQASGGVPQESSSKPKGDNPIAEKPSQDNGDNNRVDNPATDK